MATGDFIGNVGQALLTAFGMAWEVAWSLILGFTLSAMIQAYASRTKMTQLLGRDGVKEIALATLLGAISSSCSYAAVATAKSLFKKGAALAPVLAFQFASTNLVFELAAILLFLLGWQFMLAELLGGVLLVVVVAIIVKAVYPAQLVEAGRIHVETARVNDMDHGDMTAPGATIWQKLRSREGWIDVAHYFVMDWQMIWKDMIGGFLIAGAVTVFVPNDFWNALFLKSGPIWLQVGENAAIGPIIALLSFVCSIGNIPLAAVLWHGGISFGGVVAFIYGDLIVLPILNIYRIYYGWRLAAYISVVMYGTMVLVGIAMDILFRALNAVPTPTGNIVDEVTHFELNYTAVLNIAFLLFAGVLGWLYLRNPMRMGHDMAM